MKRFVGNLLCGAAMCAMVLPATGFAAGNSSAKVRTPVINAREHNQQYRINQGVKNGELTRRETGRLESQEARLRVNERFAKSDGKVSQAERERLQKELDRTSHNIYEQKHDGQTQK